MAAFEYQALDSSGRKKRGVVSADSMRAARKELRRQSLTPMKVSPVAESKTSQQSTTGSGRKLKHRELVLATRQLAMLISSGAPVEEALAAVGSGSRAPTTRTVLASVRAAIVDGRSLSDAMRAEANSFPQLYRAVVKAGEEAGALGPVLDRLAEYLEKSQEMRQKIVAAMIYPAVLAIIALMIIVALMILVVPRVVEQFETMGQDLPALTQFMVGASDFMRDRGLLLITGIALIVFLANRAMKVETIKRHVDAALLALPVFGSVIRSISAARFSRTFATLATSGTPALECLIAARETTPNLIMRDAVDDIITSVREGGSVSKAMARTEAFPSLVVHMASSGEAGGDLGVMFDKGAAYMEAEFESASTVALSLLEPLITVVMGGIVMLIILAIMLPILQLNSAALI